MIAIENTDREENIAGKMTSDFSDEGLVSWRACAQAVGYIPPVIRIIINNVTNIEGNSWTCLCRMRDELKECFYCLIPHEGCTYAHWQHIAIENHFTWKTIHAFMFFAGMILGHSVFRTVQHNAIPYAVQWEAVGYNRMQCMSNAIQK